MSFILDALRKSEAERQRQDGPSLLEVRPSKPQRRMPLWVIGLGMLLLLNVGVLLWFLLRTPPAAHANATAPLAPVLPTVTAPASASAPAAAPAVSAAPNPLSSNPRSANAPPMTVAPRLAPSSSAPVSVTHSADTTTVAPAPQPTPRPAPAPKASRPQLSPSDSADNLPDYSHMSSGLPALRLDLHSYSPQPQQRYALINMHKVKEGDTLPEGPRVLQILPDGVVLSFQGQEFVLGRN